VASGITWRSYAEGYASGVSYADRHNVFVFFSDVKNSSSLQKNIVETDSLAYDIAHHCLPQIGFIAPNLIDDGHDGTLAQADSWANAHIGPLIASPEFQADGVLIITWDEGVNDNKYGGGQICTIVVSPAARAGYRSTRFYQHESTLRFIMQAVGMSSFPGAAASAPDMSEFFPAASIAPGTPPHGGSFSLYQNYPNPFNPSTVIRYHVPRAAHVKLTLFDPLGREIGILLDAAEQEGDHDITFHGAALASGLYYCRMQSGNFSQTRTVTLLK
jgi:hypothetical protein